MTSETTLHRHPIRGLMWGLVFGVGLTGLLISFSLVPLSISNLIIYPAIVAVVSTVWGSFAPPKKPKGPRPRRIDISAPTASAPSYEEAYPESAPAGMPPRVESPAAESAPPEQPMSDTSADEPTGDQGEESPG
ncbi:MAG TPA: hypothetical protein VK960_07170 [Acidimicrobiia bacterium]|nr:hypothetical protein [Acidimicrobiia bacterium]